MGETKCPVVSSKPWLHVWHKSHSFLNIGHERTSIADRRWMFVDLMWKAYLKTFVCHRCSIKSHYELDAGMNAILSRSPWFIQSELGRTSLVHQLAFRNACLSPGYAEWNQSLFFVQASTQVFWQPGVLIEWSINVSARPVLCHTHHSAHISSDRSAPSH